MSLKVGKPLLWSLTPGPRSWGTKEQSEKVIDLGIAASAGSNTVEIALPTAQADIGECAQVFQSELADLTCVLPFRRCL